MIFGVLDLVHHQLTMLKMFCGDKPILINEVGWQYFFCQKFSLARTNKKAREKRGVLLNKIILDQHFLQFLGFFLLG